MKPLLVTLLIVFGIIIIIGLGSVLLVLWAYGAGQVMLRVLPSGTFTSFEATLLNQVGVLIVGLMVIRILSAATTNPITSKVLGKDGGNKSVEKGSKDEFPGIPLWRRPLKRLDFSDVKPNDPCPCGSGRKYQNCHGFKRSEEE